MSYHSERKKVLNHGSCKGIYSFANKHGYDEELEKAALKAKDVGYLPWLYSSFKDKIFNHSAFELSLIDRNAWQELAQLYHSRLDDPLFEKGIVEDMIIEYANSSIVYEFIRYVPRKQNKIFKRFLRDTWNSPNYEQYYYLFEHLLSVMFKFRNGGFDFTYLPTLEEASKLHAIAMALKNIMYINNAGRMIAKAFPDYDFTEMENFVATSPISDQKYRISIMRCFAKDTGATFGGQMLFL